MKCNLVLKSRIDITGNEGLIDLSDDDISRIGLSLVHFLGSRMFSFIYCDLGEEKLVNMIPNMPIKKGANKTHVAEVYGCKHSKVQHINHQQFIFIIILTVLILNPLFPALKKSTRHKSMYQ